MPLTTLSPSATRSRVVDVYSTMKRIPLTKGKHAIVDNADYEWLSKWRWQINSNGAAFRTEWKNGKTYNHIQMHRDILDASHKNEVDHINHNRLDNRRCNLRLCSRSQNAMNVRPRKGVSSKYKGVSFDAQTLNISKKWRAYINVDQKRIYLGRFCSEQGAAIAYNKAAKRLHGKFAYLNKIQ